MFIGFKPLGCKSYKVKPLSMGMNRFDSDKMKMNRSINAVTGNITVTDYTRLVA